MPTTYTDQFFTIDPFSPPPAGTAMNFSVLDVVDIDDDDIIDAPNDPLGDTVDGLDVTSSWPGDTVTINVPGVGNVTYTGITFYLTDGRQVFTPTDGQVLQNGTLVSATGVTTQGPLNVRDLGPPCFVRGTKIATLQGAKLVQDIEIGDMVLTADHGFQPVRWVGNRKVAGNAEHAPIRIAKGAMGNHRVLLVSPQHKMLVRGWKADLIFGAEEVLVPAKALINDKDIIVQRQSEVEYFHIMFDQHELIFAEGCATESFDPSADLITKDPDVFEELLALFPEKFMNRELIKTHTARPTLRRSEALTI